MVGAVAHGHARGAGDRDEPGVRLERAPRVDDLVARAGGGGDELGEDRDAAGADVHLVGGDAEALGEALAQGERRGIRIPVDVRRGLR